MNVDTQADLKKSYQSLTSRVLYEQSERLTQFKNS